METAFSVKTTEVPSGSAFNIVYVSAEGYRVQLRLGFNSGYGARVYVSGILGTGVSSLMVDSG